MNEIRRTNQGGSIVTFIIVGVILTFILVGSVYYLRQHGEQVRKDQAIAAADKQKAADEANNAKNTDNSGSSDSNGSTSTDVSPSINSTKILPVTGTKISIIQLIGVYLLTAGIVGYVTSRRSLMRSL